MRKFKFFIIMFIIIFFSYLKVGYAEENYKTVNLFINEVETNLPPAILISEHVMVPIRVFENMGFKVLWDEVEKFAIIKNSNNILMFVPNCEYVLLNNKSISIDVPVTLYQGSIYAPVSFLVETLNAELYWDAETTSGYININVLNESSKDQLNKDSKIIIDENKENKMIISSLVNEILKPYRNLTDHQKIVLFMDWIDDNIKVGLGKADPAYTIKEKVGACGSMSHLLIAMANEIGLEGRIVNLYNYPNPGVGHTVTEIKWDNKWHLYDPTYQAYYLVNSSDLSNQLDPDVSNFEQLRRNPSLVDNNRVVMNSKRLYSCLSYLKKNGERVYTEKGIYTNSEAYLNAFPAGPIGPNVPMLFPATFDLVNGKCQYGEKDNNNVDMTDIHKIPQGLYVIGSDYHNVNHKYILENLVPSKEYVLELGVVKKQPAIFKMQVSGVGLNFKQPEINLEIKGEDENKDNVNKIYFTAETSRGFIYLLHNYDVSGSGLLWTDYIRISER